MSSLQTAFQTTRGARTANWELALVSTCPRWRARRVPLSGTLSSVPVVQSPVPAGKRETCRRRRARAATPKSAFSTWPRPPCSRRASRPRHRSCDGLAVLAESANRADCQRDACRIYSRTALAQAVVTLVVVPPRAAWTQWRPGGFLDTVEGDVGALPWTDWTHRTHKNQRTENDKQRSWVVSLPTDCTPVGTRQLSPQK